MTMMRPSGNWAAPSQKMLSGALIVVNAVGDAGFHTWVGSGCCQPSQKMKLPLSMRIELMASIGNVMTELHWPCGCGPGVTGPLGTDAGLVPTELVAVTVKVYVVPLVSPDTVADVAGGVPDTTVLGCAVLPMYGVTL